MSGIHISAVRYAAIAMAAGSSITALADGPIPGSIPKGPFQVNVTPVASGLVAPNFLATSPDGTNRQFIVDQPGQIRILQNGVLQTTPFLDVSATAAVAGDRKVVTLSPGYDERGLLGMAFDPGFANPASPGFGRVFTYTSEPVTRAGDYGLPTGSNNLPVTFQSVVSSWKVSSTDANRIDTSTRQELLRFDHPQTNHNGGDLAFGPDGYLYVASGDGGGQNDNDTNGHNALTGNGQDTSAVLGKILRLDVNGTNGKRSTYGIPAGNPFAGDASKAQEIFAYGFRNPFRFSFSGSNLYVADVGQNTVEEVDKVEAGKNYGWRYKEGTFKFDPATGTVSADLTGVPAGLTDPILQYDHDDNGVVKRISIIGGYVYHGTKLAGLQGKYIFGDFSSSFGSPNGSLYYADLATGSINEFIVGNTGSLGYFVKGIGEDADGELYVMVSTNLGPSGTTGVVLALVPEPTGLAILGMGAAGLLRRRNRRG